MYCAFAVEVFLLMSYSTFYLNYHAVSYQIVFLAGCVMHDRSARFQICFHADRDAQQLVSPVKNIFSVFLDGD